MIPLGWLSQAYTMLWYQQLHIPIESSRVFPEKLAFAHHAIRPEALKLLRKHSKQLQSWKECVELCISKDITEEEDIAIEISKIDSDSAKLFQQKDVFGGLRKALVGSITGFKNLVLKEKEANN